jgi:hypothetical protein
MCRIAVKFKCRIGSIKNTDKTKRKLILAVLLCRSANGCIDTGTKLKPFADLDIDGFLSDIVRAVLYLEAEMKSICHFFRSMLTE